MKRKIFGVVISVTILASFIIFFAIPLFTVYSLPDNISMFSQDIKDSNRVSGFGSFVTTSFSETERAVSTNKEGNTYIDFKLFNLIPIKRQSVKLLDNNEVLVGGVPVGLALKANGALVIGSSGITTEDGLYDIATFGSLKVGDIITKIDDKEINSTSDISHYLNTKKSKTEAVKVSYLRNGKENTIDITPVKDILTDKYRLGVWVRDDASGIGTLTYVKENNRFGALGHPLCDVDAKSIVSVKTGKVYNCSVLGVNKGKVGNPGELRGMFLHGSEEQGLIDKNNKFGIFGELKDDSSILQKLSKAKIGGRFSVKPGKAQIKSCIDGNVKLYDIEIIKTYNKNYKTDKSMVIRVVDDELLRKTGGIVQGMSGSPILQNGKIVGAVTHVFVNDPTKGFGVYLDCMLSE